MNKMYIFILNFFDIFRLTFTFKMKKEYYLYVGGQKVKVSEDIYKVYWREREHEKDLKRRRCISG